MNPIVPVSVLMDPRLDSISGDAARSYFRLIDMIWQEAERSGRSALPATFVGDHAGVLLHSGLIVERRNAIEIPWLSKSWMHSSRVSKARQNAAKSRWDQRKHGDANAMQMQCKSNAIAY